MGIVSGAVIDGGGEVTGVIPFAMVAAGGEGEKSTKPKVQIHLNEKGREKVCASQSNERISDFSCCGMDI